MVRPFTKPDDVHGMIAAKGVLTSEGGATSHAQWWLVSSVFHASLALHRSKSTLRSAPWLLR